MKTSPSKQEDLKKQKQKKNAYLDTIGQHRAKRRKRGKAHCGAAGTETTILMLLVSVLVRVLEVQLLLSSVGPQDLTLGVIWPRGLRRVTPGAKVQVVLQPLCHGSVNDRIK